MVEIASHDITGLLKDANSFAYLRRNMASEMSAVDSENLRPSDDADSAGNPAREGSTVEASPSTSEARRSPPLGRVLQSDLMAQIQISTALRDTP